MFSKRRKPIPIVGNYQLEFGPNGVFIADLSRDGEFITINSALFSNDAWSAEDQAALRVACAKAGIDVVKPIDDD